MNIAIIQARMGSTRLPGKILLDLCDYPVIGHIVNRVKRVEKTDRVIVVTSVEGSNDGLRSFCAKNNIDCYSGSEEDVLDRYYKAATNVIDSLKLQNSNGSQTNQSGSDNVDYNIIRITGDCPLIDPDIVSDVIKFHIDNGYDYTSNTLEERFPDGLDCEVFSYQALAEAWHNARLQSEREHVTPYIRNSGHFSLGSYISDIDNSHLRWTLDEPEDYILIKKIYEALYPVNQEFTSEDVFDLLADNPDWVLINQMHARNEGMAKSLREDRIVK